MKLRLTGVDGVRRRIAKAEELLKEQVEKAIEAEAKVLLEEAKALTPVDSGALVGSGRVVVTTGKTTTAAISFGGHDAPYAQIVHEDLEARHPTGTAKYLERPLFDSAPSIHRRLGKRLILKG